MKKFDLNLLNKIIFSFTAIFIILMTGIIFQSMKAIQQKEINESNTSLVKVIGEIMTSSLKMGLHSEIFRECRKIYNNPNIKNIHVQTSDGSNLCSFKDKNELKSSQLSKKLYFDESNETLLGIVSVDFIQSNYSSSTLIFLCLLIILVLIFSFFYLVSNLLTAHIVKPLQQLSEAVNSESLLESKKKIENLSFRSSEISLLKERLDKSILNAIDKMNQDNKMQILEAQNRLSNQVSHDIRSPLEMLKSLKDEILHLPEESRRRIQLSINRIEEITYNLLRTHSQKNETDIPLKPEVLLGLINSIVVEKNIEYRNIPNATIHFNPSDESYSLFSCIQPNTLKSIISNLLNNAVEATRDNNRIIGISLSKDNNKNVIKIYDNGEGISVESYGHIFMKGFTTKKSGNGIGLHNAKLDLNNVGGDLTFESSEAKGTTFTIILPASDKPSTFVSEINTAFYERVIVLDDDPAFHEVWSKRLEGLESKIEHIFSVEEMLSKYQALHPKILLLSDFELMDKNYDGIDTILKLNHASHSVLVTARSEEKAIQDRCIAAGIKLLSKSLVNYVKVSKSVSGSSLVILIDDDKLVFLNWASHCKKQGLQFHGFKSVDEFLIASVNFDKGSRIYIDSNLGEGIKGEIESEKIFNLGFLNLYLVTGYEKESIQKPDWIKEIYSKSPENIG